MKHPEFLIGTPYSQRLAMIKINDEPLSLQPFRAMPCLSLHFQAAFTIYELTVGRIYLRNCHTPREAG